MRLIKSITLVLRMFLVVLSALIAMFTLAMGVTCMFAPEQILATSMGTAQIIGALLVTMSCMWIFTYSSYHKLKFPEYLKEEEEEEEDEEER